MKVYMGPYKDWIGPYQIAQKLCFWVKKEKDEYGIPRYPEWVHKFGAWLGGGEDKDSWLTNLCIWVESKRKRNIKIKIVFDFWKKLSSLSPSVSLTLTNANNNYFTTTNVLFFVLIQITAIFMKP